MSVDVSVALEEIKHDKGTEHHRTSAQLKILLLLLYDTI